MNIYTIRDDKASFYGTPFFSANDDVATRSFMRLTSDMNSIVSEYPADFALYKIGNFNEDTGDIVGFDAPEFIINAVTLHNRLNRPSVDSDEESV